MKILSLDENSAMDFGTCIAVLVRLPTSTSKDMFGKASIIPFSGITFFCRTTVGADSEYSNAVSFYTTLTVPMFPGSS